MICSRVGFFLKLTLTTARCPSLTGTRIHVAFIEVDVAFVIDFPFNMPQIFIGSRSDLSSSPGIKGLTLSAISGQVSNVLPAPEIACRLTTEAMDGSNSFKAVNTETYD